MIKVTVKLENNYETTYEEVEITKEDLQQLACIKAKEQYMEGHWIKSSADEIEVRTNIC